MKCGVILAAASLVAFAHAAVAGEYSLVFVNRNQAVVADSSAFITSASGSAVGWTVTIRAPGHLLLKGVAIAKLHQEIDCAGHRIRVLDDALYDKAYTIIATRSMGTRPWNAVVPDSESATLERFACDPDTRLHSQSLQPQDLSMIIKAFYNGPWPAK